MIDCENAIFNAVHPYVSPLCAKNAFRNIHTPVPSVFPSATLFEMSNTTDRTRQTGNPMEDFVIVTYEAHAYALSKAECKEVFGALDETMIRLGFLRMGGTISNNPKDTKVFEYIARYQAEFDRYGTIYRRR